MIHIHIMILMPSLKTMYMYSSRDKRYERMTIGEVMTVTEYSILIQVVIVRFFNEYKMLLVN